MYINVYTSMYITLIDNIAISLLIYFHRRAVALLYLIFEVYEVFGIATVDLMIKIIIVDVVSRNLHFVWVIRQCNCHIYSVT